MRAIRRRKLVLRASLAVALILGASLGLFIASDNFAEVQPGRIYRSAQLSETHLGDAIRAHSLKTVLNLRGPNPNQAWYLAEKATTLRSGATQIDLSMATDQRLSRAQARTIIEVLETCDKPVLIHCQFGSERTGLVATIAELLREGSTLADARAQLSLRYKFLPYKDGLVMLGHLDQYETYLKRQGLSHSAQVFREYMLEEYKPAGPSREDWQFTPYPLVVIHRPEVPVSVGRNEHESAKR